MKHSIEKIVNAYVQIRDQKKELADRHKEEIKPFNDKLKTLESVLLRELDNSGGESVRCKSGTVYRIHRTSSKVENWDEVLQFILDNELYHILEKRVSKSAVEEYVEANGEAPPGVAITTDATVGVRRS